MADDSGSTKVTLDLDNSDFVSKMKDAMDTISSFGEAGESLSGFVGILGEIGAVVGVAAVAVLAFKAAIDLNVEAEKIKQVHSSFEALAASAGVSATKLKDGMTEAAKGLIDETSLLEATNKGIIAMGDNAGKLPEIMDIARKATVVMGGDMTDNFENITQAIARGNTKMLARYGIILDNNKVLADYAKTQGVSVNYLDEEDKKTALMNAALDQAKAKFAGVNESTLATTNNLQKISVAFTEIKETAILAWDKVAGPAVTAMVANIAGIVHNFATSFKAAFGSGEDQAKAQQEVLGKNIKSTEEQIELYKKMGNAEGVAKLTADLEKQKAELDALNQKQEKFNQAKAKEAEETEKAGAAAKKAAEDEAHTAEGGRYEKIKKEREKLNAELVKLNQQLVQDQLKNETDITKVDQEQADKKIAIEKAAQEQIKKIRKEAADAGLQNSKTVIDATTAIQKKAEIDIRQVDMQTNQERLRILQNYENANATTARGVQAAWDKEGEKARQDMQNFAKAGETAFTTVGNNATKAFQEMGSGSKSASQAMAGFFLSSLGQMAEKQGEVMVLAGLWPTDPVVIAAGGALIALGAALGAAGGGGGASSSGRSSGGSVGGTYGASSTQAAATAGSVAAPTASQQEQKNVSVNIAGNYFETDQTRTALMDTIRQAGDFTDFQYKQIGQP